MLESDMNERLRNRLVTVHGLDFGIHRHFFGLAGVVYNGESFKISTTM